VARLLDILAARHPGASKRTLRQMLAHERVTVDGRTVIRADMEVPEGAHVALGPKMAVTPVPDAVNVVYEDRHLLVIDKPAGLLSVAPREAGSTSAWAAVHKYLACSDEKPLLVHRLDKAASGLLVFAKTEVVQESLHEMFSRRELERVYLAVVDGQPRTDSGVVTTRLIESDRRPYRVRSLHAGDPPELSNRAERACTHWRVIGRDGGRAALLVRLETGKKHQIRVHLSELGCPIVGDRMYGGPSFQRLLLHAALLRFQHPITGAQVLTISGPDPAFRRAFPRLPDPLPSGFDAGCS
jgi:23S rRNA pseudouridine1911/1915/1917 synthase